jgi:anthranilate phosphoribosyltransferase
MIFLEIMTSFPLIFQRLRNGYSLPQKQMETLFEEIFLGKASADDIEEILLFLQKKGETFEEIAGAASVMRRHSIAITPKVFGLLDVCGTGGSGEAKTFNVSTIVAFVLAGAGIPVAKHGNRSSSSMSGSADVLELMGVSLTTKPEEVTAQIEKIGIGFLFAPSFHPAMKFVQPVRKKLGIRTIFNLLGPLTNPAKAGFQLMGVFDHSLCEPVAKALKLLGVRSAMVVHGEDGLDEITTTGKTFYAWYKDQEKIETGTIEPQFFGIKRAVPDSLKGGSVKANAEIMRGILSGKLGGEKKDLVLINSAAAFFIVGKCQSFEEGILLAKESINSGNALKKIEQLKMYSHNSDRSL